MLIVEEEVQNGSKEGGQERGREVKRRRPLTMCPSMCSVNVMAILHVILMCEKVPR